MQKYKKIKIRMDPFKVYLFTLHTIRVKHSAASSTRLDKYMIFNCKSGSSLHCDCVQSIIKNMILGNVPNAKVGF